MAEYLERETAVMRLMQDGCSAKNVQTIMALPAASVPQWISVKDGMPENEKQVILLRRNGKVSRAEVRKIGETVRFRLYSEEDDYSPVTHWAAFPAMPLPEPPKGENDG